MPGDETITPLSQAMKLTDQCMYKTYTDPFDLKKSEVRSDSPKCGFNN